MNGRIYDPQLGRFLSADPTMQHPYSSQGQNRYAYVQNNPLKYVDMSGFGFFSKLWKGTLWKGIKKILSHPLARIAVAAVAAYFTAGRCSAGRLRLERRQRYCLPGRLEGSLLRMSVI